MNDPVVASFQENTVRLLASNVITGRICKHRTVGRSMTYIGTYRLTGETAPTLNQLKNEGTIMFQDNPEQEPIESDDAIDVYCYCNNGNNTDSKIGKLIIRI